MQNKYKIKIVLYSECDYKGNCSVYYYAGKKRTKDGNFIPKTAGIDNAQTFSNKTFAEYNKWLIDEFLKWQFDIGSYYTKLIEC